MKFIVFIVSLLFICTNCINNYNRVAIDKIKMCTEINDYDCPDDNPSFSLFNKEIFISCRINKTPPKTKIEFRWYFLGRKRVRIKTDIVGTEQKKDTIYFQSSLKKPGNGWPVGEYEVIINILNLPNEPTIKKFTIQ